MTGVDTARDDGRYGPEAPRDENDPVPGAVDWLLGILTGVIGLVLGVIGVEMYTQVDRALIAEVVAREEVELGGLTRSEFVTAGAPFVDWLAIGIALTGLVSVVAAVAFVHTRRRTRSRVSSEGGTTATSWACAVYGAAVTALVSTVVPLVSAVLGGSTAAYLHDRDSGARTGAVAGLIGTVLTIPFTAFLAVGLIAGGGAIGESAAGALLATVLVVAELIMLVLNSGFGALGGILADRFA